MAEKVVVGSITELGSGSARHWSPQMTSYTQPQPRYCEKCGSELDVIDNRIERFDRYTGLGYKRGSIILRCPEWEQDPIDTSDNGHDNIPWNPDQKPVTVQYRGLAEGQL